MINQFEDGMISKDNSISKKMDTPISSNEKNNGKRNYKKDIEQYLITDEDMENMSVEEIQLYCR